MIRIIFCAVPAFMRVEPATTSSPVSARIGCEQAARMGASALLEMPMVCAPRGRLLQSRDGEGRRPLAATPITTSFGPTLASRMPAMPCSTESSAFSTAFRTRACAAGDQVDELVVGPVEGRRQLGAVLDADAAGRAGADIDEPPAAPQTLDRFFRSRSNGGKRWPRPRRRPRAGPHKRR